MPVVNFEWTDERVEVLKTLWGQGLSASKVAAAMGCESRSAIIGKVHRLNLPPRGKKVSVRKPAYVPRERQPRMKFKEPRRAPPKDNKTAAQRHEDAARLRDFFATETGPVEGGIAFFDLKPCHCRWPLGDPSDLETFRYCGEVKSVDGGSYCEHHHQMSLPAYLREAAE